MFIFWAILLDHQIIKSMKYKIKRGNHFANFTWNRLFPFVPNKISGVVHFSYSSLIKELIPGWNKLTGISSFKIHENSARLVWRSDGGKINIAGYVYYNGVRNEMLITSLQPGIYYKYSIEYKYRSWIITINNKTIIMPGKIGFCKFRCYPFFGGRSTAPEDIYIEL